jgi:catechol 2,3-dioxygenase-like lactoylglutathione lyase family enzyme
MTTTLQMAPAVRFHLSLNVSDLKRSVAFYRTLFGTEPAKLRGDYAKFELVDPPLVLSLEPSARGAGGPLNHLGFRLPDAPTLVAMQERLERAGIRSQREVGVECCYARQTKFWVTDSDRTLWEIYTFEGDLEHRGEGQSLEEMLPEQDDASAAEPVSWEHVIINPVPESIPLPDAGVDEVRFRGTFNLPLSTELQIRLIREAFRVLKPSGRIFLHVLVGDRPFDGRPQLPGPAAAVQHVPVQSELLQLLEKSGFRRMQMLKFDAKPCFVREGVAMRELQLEAFKVEDRSERSVAVLYKGPFRQIADDSETVYPRGQWVQTTESAAQALRESDGFVIDRM